MVAICREHDWKAYSSIAADVIGLSTGGDGGGLHSLKNHTHNIAAILIGKYIHLIQELLEQGDHLLKNLA